MFTNIFSERHWKCLLFPVTFTENINERHCAATVFTTPFLQCEVCNYLYIIETKPACKNDSLYKALYRLLELVK